MLLLPIASSFWASSKQVLKTGKKIKGDRLSGMQEEQSREDMGPRLSLMFDSTKVTVYCMAAQYMFFGQLPQQVLFPYLHLSRMLRAGERGSTYMPNKYNNPLLYDS